MRVCDWIADYLKSLGVERVHGLMGGGAAGLNDGFIKQNMPYVCYHHEQGAGHAAIGESKYTGKLSVVNPTTGCAGTNCATSVLDAWQDSVPVLFISGNVRRDTCSGWINQTKGVNIRKYGIQEHHVVDTYKSITKYSKFVIDPLEVAHSMQQAVYLATTGRPGPVWVDIPGDIQLAQMPENPSQFQPPVTDTVQHDYTDIKNMILNAERPVVLAGYGIRQSGLVDEFVEFVEKYNIPYVSTYGARDYTANEHPLSIGAVGQRGSRAGNFAMQNADLLLILGSSLNASVVGYDPKQFAPASIKVLIDTDWNELHKNIVKIDHKCQDSLDNFFKAMI
jgi:acetolactate synthase-1/2/3 large subunit